MHKRFLFLTFFLLLINAILWVFLVPVWHFPDEQAHFAQVAFIAEKGHNPDYREPLDLTEEIYQSEKFLGTDRDNIGNNKFTFHPEFRIEYTDSLIGKYEKQISDLTFTSSRQSLVKKESSHYPISYYFPAAVLYRVLYSTDLFIRIYAVRFWSVFLFLLNLYVIYKIAKLLFTPNKLFPLIMTLLVGFQPMMVFSNVGVNSDALGNLLFTIFLYLCAHLLINGATFIKLIQFILIIALSLYSKTQFFITLPLFILITLYLILRDYQRRAKKILLLAIIIAIITGFYLGLNLRVGLFSLINQFFHWLNLDSLVKFNREYTISHTYREVLPWYWGIYDWLGVTYPRIVHRIINWIVLLSGLGVVMFAIKLIRQKKYHLRKFQTGVYFTFVSIFYFVAISFYDWYSWYKDGFQLGVQGRYFFPVISVHMLIILIGWKELFAFKINLKDGSIKLLGFLMILLNIYALYTVSGTYYSLSSLNTFIIQASQYKPWFVKGLGLSSLIVTFFITLTVFLIEYKSYPHEKEIQ